MNSFLNIIYGADRINQSVAVLGGATAQSYGVVGLSKPVSESAPDLVALDAVSGLRAEEFGQRGTDTDAVALKPFVESFVPVTSSIAPAAFVLDEQFESPGFSSTDPVLDPELMSRFDTPEAELPALSIFAPPPGNSVGDVDAGVEGAASGASASFLSFIEQVIAQVESSRDDFNGSFDGERQSSVRATLEEIGSEVAASIRSTLQDNVAGVGRESASDVVDMTGVPLLASMTEPALSVNYYGESALLINGALDSASQPISAFSLPPVGPTLASPQDELAGFTS